MLSPREAIARLADQGVSQRQIAAAIGRDPSIVSRVASGLQPGTSYAGALDSLARGAVASPPAARSGDRPVPVASMIDPRGRSPQVRAMMPPAEARDTLARDTANLGGKVVITVHVADGLGGVSSVDLFTHGGLDEAQLDAILDDYYGDDWASDLMDDMGYYTGGGTVVAVGVNPL